MNKSKRNYENQIASLENEIKFYAEENKTLKENIEKKKKETKQRSLEIENDPNDKTLTEIKNLTQEIEKMKKDIDKLNKVKGNLEEEIKTLGIISGKEQEKSNKGCLEGLKKQVEQLKKNKKQNSETILKITQDKENLEKELKEIEKMNNLYQKEIEESLESINILNEKENTRKKKHGKN